MTYIGRYFFNPLVAIDQLANTVLCGDPDETISSRIGKRLRSDTVTYPEKLLSKALNIFDKNHCIEAIEEDEGNQ